MADDNQAKSGVVPAPPAPPPASGSFRGLRVSLMPQDLEGAGGPDFKLRLLILFLVLIVETGGILGYQYFLSQQVSERLAQRDQLMTEMDRVDRLAAQKEQELLDALTFTRKLDAVEALLDQHVYPSLLIDRIEELRLPYVAFERVNVDMRSGLVSIDAVSSEPSWPHRRMAQQIVKFTGESDVLEVRNTSISTAASRSGGFGGVTTTFLLRMDPAIWLKDRAEVLPAGTLVDETNG